MTLLSKYTDLLASLDVVDKSGEGLLTHVPSYNDTAKETKVVVDGRRLALPIRDILKHNDFSQVIPFHPLSENVTYGRSVIIDALAKYIEHKVNTVLGCVLAPQLLAAATHPAKQKGLSSKQANYLKGLTEADDKFAENVNKILAAKTGKGGRKTKFIQIVLTRGGQNASGYSRSSVVTSPLMSEIRKVEETGAVFGVKVRKKDYKLLTNLFGYLFTEDPESAFTTGSKSDIAPYLHALLGTYKKLADHINNIVGETVIDVSWADILDNFAKYQREIPALVDSMGIPPRGVTATADPTEVFVQPARAKAPPRPNVVNPAPSPVPLMAEPQPGVYMTPTERRRQGLAAAAAAPQPLPGALGAPIPGMFSNRPATNPLAAAANAGGFGAAQPQQLYQQPQLHAPVQSNLFGVGGHGVIGVGGMGGTSMVPTMPHAPQAGLPPVW